MKRMLMLLAALLMLGLPALAEDSPSAEAALRTLYPSEAILARAEDEDDAFFVLKMGENQPKLCSFRLTDGGWILTLDSDTAIRPNQVGDMYSRHLYDRIELQLEGDKLSIVHRYGKNIWWTYDFVREEAGQWRFLRLYTADEGNRMYDELTLADGCVSQTYTRKWRDTQEVSHTPPCPMPWLAPCQTLAGFDAAAFPMDLHAMLDEDLSRVAAELFPDYRYVNGKFSTIAATFLMDNADGERFFFGGVYEDGYWVWTKSTPLPENTFCDSFHGGAGTLPISFVIPGSEPDDWGEYPWAEYNIVLQEDGRWLVEGMFNEDDDDYLHFEEGGVSLTMMGKVYGDCRVERDITKIDWANYPLCIMDVLATMSDEWGVIGEPDLPLFADTEESVLLGHYLYATPVQVLGYEEDDHDKGWEGYLARVRIAGGDMEGWMPAYGLFLGAEQVWQVTEMDDGEEWSYLTTVEGELAMLGASLPAVTLRAGAPLYRTMDGDVLWSAEEDTEMILMADLQNGWYHVRFDDTWDMFLESGFVRYEDCLTEE